MQKAFTHACNARFHTFLYAVILQEKSGVSLTVLSLLARHNMDPWEEAARYARTPGKATVCELSHLLYGVMPCSSDERIRTAAVRLLRLLPSPNFTDPIAENPIWPVLAGLLKRLKDATGTLLGNDRR
jgi:hypothetical protein